MSKLKLSILAPLSVFILTLISGFTGGVYYWQERRDSEMLDKISNDFGGIFDHLIINSVDMMESTLDAISRDEKLAAHFLARDREKVLADALPLFQALLDKHKITHFYLSDSDRVNFLRVHQPKRFGDTIDRITTVNAQRNQTVSSGLELGPLGTFTLRVVMPWIKEDQPIGYLELGSEINHIVSGVSDILKLKLHVFIPKENLVRRDWESGVRMLGFSQNWDQLENYVVSEAALLPEFLVDHVNSGGLQGEKIVKDIQSGDRVISLLHWPIVDAAGEEAAVIVAAYDETALDSKRTQFIFWTIIVSSLIGGGLLWLFWLILDRVEQDIRRYDKSLIQAKEEAELSNLAKTQFLANMSHELRTPLNAILGFSEMMQIQAYGPLGSNKYIEYANDIHFSGSHLLSLINDILHISKIEAGRQALHMETFTVTGLVNECLTMVHERANALEVTLVNALDDDLPPIFADRRALQQCVINLLSNAIKFTSKGGSVTISASFSPQWFELSVADTGMGIAKEDLPKLTQPFTQIERSQTARIHEGTGLGLTITRNLVEMHGGTLQIDSQLDVGTTATIRLPLGHPPMEQPDPA